MCRRKGALGYSRIPPHQPRKAIPPRSSIQLSAFKEIRIKEVDVFDKEFGLRSSPDSELASCSRFCANLYSNCIPPLMFIK